ncbi:hypothetical protein OsJ_30365 [Oryza sativa Japonica Group]|uniref:Peptidase C1A papain C-terminal domain-containing protein n=2 Tax=Oryza sativa subsp. japonica TaxID=39947 RepID=B9G545_ORYSJ|nr:hypothetical protein OsJ_30365 [Oryza sativa Japonica Group]
MSYWLGLNKFADMTSEEFMAKYTGAKVDDTGVSGAGAASEADRGGAAAGSCWAFSAVGAVEGINAIMTGNLLTLSEQQVLDCFGAGDCSGGWPDQAQQYIVKNGITLDRCGKEPYYPAYDATKHPCRTVAGKQPIITVDDVKWVNKSEAALLLKVYQQPISVALDASGWQFYQGGVFTGPCQTPPPLNHAVLVVGYGVTTRQNSGSSRIHGAQTGPRAATSA